jgi:hypothetical protein
MWQVFVEGTGTTAATAADLVYFTGGGKNSDKRISAEALPLPKIKVLRRVAKCVAAATSRNKDTRL